MNNAILDVAAERRRQVEEEGWSTEHDDDCHGEEELAMAAACYAAPCPIYVERRTRLLTTFADPWPWVTGHHRGEPVNLGTESVKGSKDRRRQLVIAAALLIAEIERMDRRANWCAK